MIMLTPQMKSLKAIVMLFTHEAIADSEEFDGLPNVVYSQGLKTNRLYDEAKRFFSEKGWGSIYDG